MTCRAGGAFQVHLGSGAHAATIKRLEEGMPSSRFHWRFPSGPVIVSSCANQVAVRSWPEASSSTLHRVLRPQAIRTAQLIDPFGDNDDVATALLALRRMEDIGRLAAHSGGRPWGSVLSAEPS